MGILIALVPSLALAHPARMATAIAAVSADGAVSVTVTFDLPAYLVNDTPDRVPTESMESLVDGPAADLEQALAETRARFERGVRILADGADVPGATTKFPSAADLHSAAPRGSATRFPAMLSATQAARLPAGTRSFEIRFPEVLGPIVLTVERPNVEMIALACTAGDGTGPLPVELAAPSTQRAPAAAGASPAPAEPGSLHIARQYLVLGFEHILPKGLDHILFVLGLFFLSPKLRPLLWQVTAFTIAHSITLGLAMYGLVRLPASVVEPTIALSIAFIAVENLYTTELKPWRPVVVFLFGLVHGLGFAGVLSELGLPRGAFVPALVSFNVGVELGQLSVIALALVAVGWYRKDAWYRRTVVVPASLLIAAMGLFWTVERIFFT